MGDELGAREGTAKVDGTDDRAQVGAPDRLAALADHGMRREHEVCVPLIQMLS
jgi:hypothetical protein